MHGAHRPQAAFEAIARTLPFGSVSFENAITENGERLIWLPPNVAARAIATSLCASRSRRRLPLGADDAKLPLGAE